MSVEALSAEQISLGILAGGRATRLAGRDKAWIERGGIPQVVRWQRRFATEVAHTLVSANQALDRYRAHGLEPVADPTQDAHGPIAGLEALAAAARTPWLLTLPVDLVGVNDCLLPTLVAERAADGAYAQDADGPQPLVALWRVDALRAALVTLPPEAHGAVHALQARMRMACVIFAGVRFGNLNTPDDLAAAGIAHD